MAFSKDRQKFQSSERREDIIYLELKVDRAVRVNKQELAIFKQNLASRPQNPSC